MCAIQQTDSRVSDSPVTWNSYICNSLQLLRTEQYGLLPNGYTYTYSFHCSTNDLVAELRRPYDVQEAAERHFIVRARTAGRSADTVEDFISMYDEMVETGGVTNQRTVQEFLRAVRYIAILIMTFIFSECTLQHSSFLMIQYIHLITVLQRYLPFITAGTCVTELV